MALIAQKAEGNLAEPPGAADHVALSFVSDAMNAVGAFHRGRDDHRDIGRTPRGLSQLPSAFCAMSAHGDQVVYPDESRSYHDAALAELATAALNVRVADVLVAVESPCNSREVASSAFIPCGPVAGADVDRICGSSPPLMASG